MCVRHGRKNSSLIYHSIIVGIKSFKCVRDRNTHCTNVCAIHAQHFSFFKKKILLYRSRADQAGEVARLPDLLPARLPEVVDLPDLPKLPEVVDLLPRRR